ncbi:MAG: hypothetical protein IT375_31255 [Polyangiaceae bacterium]|nr:hypothetical protein [Polyangiaceae bacterium]
MSSPLSRATTAWIVCAGLFGCAGPADEQATITPAPRRESFPPVADMLHSHCGSLDCHGSRVRNLRIYGINGLRIDGISGTGPTTADEYDATYRAIVYLEPEKLSRVVADGGRNPKRLSLVRKARGAEEHKGGTMAPQGSEADRCLTSWIAGALDAPACALAAEMSPPEGF